MILFEKENVKVEYDSSVPCVVWIPSGDVIGKDFRESFEIGMTFAEKQIKENPNLGWLNDTRKLKTTKKEDLEWLSTVANKRASKGLKKIAFSLPEDVFGKIGIRLYVFQSMRSPDNKLDIKAFNTIEEAKLWLKGMQGVKLNEVRLSINQKAPE